MVGTKTVLRSLVMLHAKTKNLDGGKKSKSEKSDKTSNPGKNSCLTEWILNSIQKNEYGTCNWMNYRNFAKSVDTVSFHTKCAATFQN